jgi:hypothetical protein
MPVRYQENEPHRLPGQPLPKERKALLLPEPTFDQIDDGVLQSFSGELLDFYLQHKSVFVRFYMARKQIFEHKGYQRLNRFTARFFDTDSPFYKHEYTTVAPPLFKFITSSFPSQRSPITHPR